jgi:hypothetical protein
VWESANELVGGCAMGGADDHFQQHAKLVERFRRQGSTLSLACGNTKSTKTACVSHGSNVIL